jgi:hypothetical protein
MPRFKIETSLFEPVTIEVEGGRTYESVPLSPRLIREMSKLEEQRKAKTLGDDTIIVQEVALIFGLEAKEVETIDIRILAQILEHATGAMMGGKAGKVQGVATSAAVQAEEASPPPVALAVDEVTASKNVPKPEGEISQ